METFHIDYSDDNTCQMAHAVEAAVNTCDSAEYHIKAIKRLFPEDEMQMFYVTCIRYWGEATEYDLRNRYAVLCSRRIMEQYPSLTETPTLGYILMEAFAFTRCAHRYLQNELFKDILHYWKETGFMGIAAWVEKQQFVINDSGDALIPYQQYIKQKYQ